MIEKRTGFKIIICLISILFAYVSTLADTWRLEADGQWQLLSDQKPKDRYLLAVAELKQLIHQSKTEAVKEKTEQIKRDFPEVAGEDLDAYISAEILYSEGKFTQAIRKYDEFMGNFPQSELFKAALQREYEIGLAYLRGRRKKVIKALRIRGYAEGEKIMDGVIDRAGDSPIAIKAAIAIANSYESRGKYREAYYEWSEISSRWPTGETGRKALLGMARCKHAAYGGPKYDSSDLVSAKTYYENFRLRYPEQAKELEIDKKVSLINEQLAWKQYTIGRYYKRTGSNVAADKCFTTVIDKWPGTRAAKMSKRMMIREKPIEKEHKWLKLLEKYVL